MSACFSRCWHASRRLQPAAYGRPSSLCKPGHTPDRGCDAAFCTQARRSCAVARRRLKPTAHTPSLLKQAPPCVSPLQQAWCARVRIHPLPFRRAQDAASPADRGCDATFCRQAAQAAFVVYAAGFSPTATGRRIMRAAGLKPAARVTKSYGRELWRATACITPPDRPPVALAAFFCYTLHSNKRVENSTGEAGC